MRIGSSPSHCGPRQNVAFLLGAVALASCAAPPITLYALNTQGQSGTAVALAPQPIVIAISRLTLPDDLDTQDIIVRHGSVMESSHRGRWASRLSLGATELVTARLAENRPDALVTSQPQITTPTYRILINVSRLDLAATGKAMNAGTATLDADWLIVPRNPAVATMRDRTSISLAGEMATDGEVVALTTRVLSRLAATIDVSRLR